MEFQPHAEFVVPIGSGWQHHIKVQVGVAAGGSEADRLESFAETSAADIVSQMTDEQRQYLIDKFSAMIKPRPSA